MQINFPKNTSESDVVFTSAPCKFRLVFVPDLWNPGGGRMFASCSTPLPRPELIVNTKHYVVQVLRVLVRRFKWRHFILHWVKLTTKTFVHTPPPKHRASPPREGTWDQVARMEVTSYKDPPPPPTMDRMTDICKNITLPQTSFAGGKYTRYSRMFVVTELFNTLSQWKLVGYNPWVRSILF